MKEIIFATILFPFLCSITLATDKWDISKEEFEQNLYEGKFDPGDFIKYTEEVLNVLDKVDAIMLNPNSTKKEARQSINDLDASIKKYERLGPGRWKDEAPQKIRGQIINSRISFDLYFMGGEKKFLDDARSSASEARELFRAYKDKFR